MTVASAHEGPLRAVEGLTDRMDAEGKSAATLLQRAMEYRAMGNAGAAESDLLEAIELNPKYVVAAVELAKLYLAQKRPADGLLVVNGALDQSSHPAGRAELLAARGAIQALRNEFASAATDYGAALELRPAKLDWLLERSRVLAKLGRHSDRIAGLWAAMEENSSVVLEIELVEALLDGGKHEEGLERIEAEIASSRWKSAWFIRRARALRGLGETDRARRDLRAAVSEIESRMNPDRPDITLLIERGIARAYLGDLVAAQRDLGVAVALGGLPWATEPLEALLR